MARQASVLKLRGPLGDVSFYKSKDGYLAREKGGVSASRIKTDPAYARTRENGSEFGNAGTAGKLFRDSLRSLIQYAGDTNLTARTTKLMTQIKNFDTESIRGERNVAMGILEPAAKGLLKGFNFNNRSVMGSVLFANYRLNKAARQFDFIDFVPVRDVKAPAGATHVTLRGAVAVIDFASGTSDVVLTSEANIPIDEQTQNVVMAAAADPEGTGAKLFLLSVLFFQEVNGVQYSLRNGVYNALCVVDVEDC